MSDEQPHVLLRNLTPDQQRAVQSTSNKTLVVAGAGAGKTEVMSRRVAWWISEENVPKSSILAFTFTERAAQEMKFRIRSKVEQVTPAGSDATLGNMYVGTIHGFCIKALRELAPDDYHQIDMLDEVGRMTLVWRGYHNILGLGALQEALGLSQYQTAINFMEAYDLLQEYGLFEVELAGAIPPNRLDEEIDWCRASRLLTNVGSGAAAQAFSISAARYYAYLKCRRFLDFSTSQAELVRLLLHNPSLLRSIRSQVTHVMVDEVQDVNPIQDTLIRLILGEEGKLTAVGDHRQAIFKWRGGRVDIMAELYDEAAQNDGVIELKDNFRSTPRIIDVANEWADGIDPVRSMSSPHMIPGQRDGEFARVDKDPSHVAARIFSSRENEAEWIASTITELVKPDSTGAFHDTRDGARGLTLSDIAVLVRSSTDVRTYMNALEARGIPAIVKAGPDLFVQPEVLLCLSILARLAGIDEFFGATATRRIQAVLGCRPQPELIIRSAAQALRQSGLPLTEGIEDHIIRVADLWFRHVNDEVLAASEIAIVRTEEWREALRRKVPRRVFPQNLYHWVLAETGIAQWDGMSATSHRATTAMYHLGQLSKLILGLETPGWTNPRDFKSQVISLALWGFEKARPEESPMLVPPDAVTVSTIHSVKGLEFAAVFVADVVPKRFPSQFATRLPSLPFDGDILSRINPNDLVDDANRNDERRLMYVALTRAERYLYVSTSGTANPSRSSRTPHFFAIANLMIVRSGGVPYNRDFELRLEYLPSAAKRDLRLTTSFSDLRYYLECPHDFYLRKVLGFAPTIDQAFGYGRGVHNLMRVINSDPTTWADLADDREKLEARIGSLIESGLFYLRYTASGPAENMHKRATEIVANYIQSYRHELSTLTFEAEKPFETLLPEADVLIAGTVDAIRLDQPPRVSLLDFKSGEAGDGRDGALDKQAMMLQVTTYGLAAKNELEYEPDRGLVRYLGTGEELSVELSGPALDEARSIITSTAAAIRKQEFHKGPTKPHGERCLTCDFQKFCGLAR